MPVTIPITTDATPSKPVTVISSRPISLSCQNGRGLVTAKALPTPMLTAEKTPEKIRAYQLESYYDGKWRSAYDPWVEQLASFNRSPEYPRMAWNQALTSVMIFTQPVVHEFGALRVPELTAVRRRVLGRKA